MTYGKVIELFLVNGTADSLITAELSNWNGMAVKIPRVELSSCNNDDITKPGVYFLFCKEDDGSDSVYIGEARMFKKDLNSMLGTTNPIKKHIIGILLLFLWEET